MPPGYNNAETSDGLKISKSKHPLLRLTVQICCVDRPSCTLTSILNTRSRHEIQGPRNHTRSGKLMLAIQIRRGVGDWRPAPLRSDMVDNPMHEKNVGKIALARLEPRHEIAWERCFNRRTLAAPVCWFFQFSGRCMVVRILCRPLAGLPSPPSGFPSGQNTFCLQTGTLTGGTSRLPNSIPSPTTLVRWYTTSRRPAPIQSPKPSPSTLAPLFPPQRSGVTNDHFRRRPKSRNRTWVQRGFASFLKSLYTTFPAPATPSHCESIHKLPQHSLQTHFLNRGIPPRHSYPQNHIHLPYQHPRCLRRVPILFLMNPHDTVSFATTLRLNRPTAHMIKSMYRSSLSHSVSQLTGPLSLARRTISWRIRCP